MKRKSLKRLLLAAATILTMAANGIVANAAGTATLTVKASEPGHAFEAYQVFKGDYAEKEKVGVLSNIEWGNGVNGGELLAALKQDSVIGTHFTGKTTAAEVAEVLQDETNFASDSANLDQFASIAAAHLTENKASLSEGKKDGVTYPYTATLDYGYYLIKDRDDSAPASGSYTKFMLQLISNAEVEAKLDTPTIDKTVEGSKGNAAGIGKTVTFKLTSRVPKMDGYNRYYFVVHDTLSKGLEFVDGSVEITIGDAKLPEEDYTVTAGASGEETALKIVLVDFLDKNKDNIGKTITIQYNAKVTEKAAVGNEGNTNTAKLEYSNNPSYEYEGNEKGEKPEVPTGETTDTKTYTYTGQLKVAKVDEDGMPLSGAKFKLEGDGITQLVDVTNRTTTTYVRNDQGDYVKDDSGNMVSYVESQYQGKDRYNQVTVTDTVVTVDGQSGPSGSIEASVDKNGYLVFTGLGAGSYTLTETKAPDGYNKLSAPINIQLKCDITDNTPDAPTCEWTAAGCRVEKDGTILLSVENKKGSMLPSTGGIGTAIFTVSGLILMLGAAVILVIKRKKGRS